MTIKPLKMIFQKSVDSEKLPEVWKLANVTPISKTGSESKEEHYRPISTTSVPGKILERCIRDDINLFMPNGSFHSY